MQQIINHKEILVSDTGHTIPLFPLQFPYSPPKVTGPHSLPGPFSWLVGASPVKECELYPDAGCRIICRITLFAGFRGLFNPRPFYRLELKLFLGLFSGIIWDPYVWKDEKC